MSKEFEISKLLKITANNKYEATVAAFEVVNNLNKINIPKKEQNRKPAVKAMLSLARDDIQYDYIDDATRLSLEEELQNRVRQQNESAINAVFSTSESNAPASDDLDEDLDEIGEMEPLEVFTEPDSEATDEDGEEIEEESDEDSDDDE